jgi:hypothetical protein
MNFAEGKGPKQVKKGYTLGQFVTVYGQDGTPGTVNPANPPYTPIASGSAATGGITWTGAIPGAVNPGLNLNVQGNGATDVSIVCAPGAQESLQDIEYLTVALTTAVGFSGSAVVTLQGTNRRSTNATVYSGSNWVSISGVTVSGSQAIFNIGPSSTPQTVFTAYRLIASGSTASGIVDWAIPGLFIDFSAMGIGSNAGDANGNIGQMSIQNPVSYTVQSGQYTATSNGNTPYAATANNADYYGA